MSKRRLGRINWGVVSLKTFLSLLVIAGSVDIIYRAYILFTHQINPVIGTILFLVEVGFWIWLVTVLRMPKYQYSKPGFWLVFGAVLGITLVCAFAGMQPLSAYKDSLFSSISNRIRNVSNPIQPNNTGTGTQTTTIASSWAEIPDGYYESDAHYLGRTITIKGTTLTMDCKIRTEPFGAPDLSWPQLGVHTYEYKLHSIPSSIETPTEPAPLDKANLIYLTDVVNGFTIDIPFKYMAEYNIIQLADETGDVESYRLK
jgi:hypothetical protein